MKSEIKNKIVGILYGGATLEGQVSILTAKAVEESLSRQGFDTIDIQIDEPEFLPKINSVDIVFNCLHGDKGEDGKIQGLLEVLGKPYTGSGVFTSALCRDKVRFKEFIISKRFLTPDYITLREITDLNFTFPVVIKPRQGGGGIGIQLIESFAELQGLLETKDAFFKDSYFVEEFIKGNILTVGLIESEGQLICSPVIEIILTNGKEIYDFDAKINSNATYSILTNKHSEEVRNVAKSLYESTNCFGFARIDFVLKGNKIYVLEINTIPSLFEGSTSRYATKKLNIEFDNLCSIILQSAFNRKTVKNYSKINTNILDNLIYV